MFLYFMYVSVSVYLVHVSTKLTTMRNLSGNHTRHLDGSGCGKTSGNTGLEIKMLWFFEIVCVRSGWTLFGQVGCGQA